MGVRRSASEFVWGGNVVRLLMDITCRAGVLETPAVASACQQLHARRQVNSATQVAS